jgi:hypothetical protein
LLSGNLGIIGSSGSGKSWLAGLLVEELLRRDYQVCVIDPEGDYRGLRAFPHTLLLGGTAAELPPVIDLITLLEFSHISLVLDLSSYNPEARQRYVGDLMRGLLALRARWGRPHWVLVDEIHGFCPPAGGLLTDLFSSGMRQGGFAVLSYLPSQVAPELLRTVQLWVIMRLLLEEEIDVLKGYLRLCEGTLEELGSLAVGQAYLCHGAKEGPLTPSPQLVSFRAARRVVPHIRHLQKYLHAPLPEPKRFYFQGGASSGVCCAANLWEFRKALEVVPAEDLRDHLQRGDFARWLAEVLHDKELARRVGKLARRSLTDGALREALLITVAQRYEELRSLI